MIALVANLVDMARRNPFIRLAISGLSGLVAGVGFYAWNKKLDKRHRREIAIVAGIATAVIVWLLLGPNGIQFPSQPSTSVNVGPIDLPANGPINIGPVILDGGDLPGLNYNPQLLFYNPPQEQTATTCGCAERFSAWGPFIQSLWQTLDQVFPQGPDNGVSNNVLPGTLTVG